MRYINNSEISTWQRCKRLYYYREVLKLEPIKAHVPFVRGTLIHALVEQWHKKPGDRIALFREYARLAAELRNTILPKNEDKKEELEKIIFSARYIMLEYIKQPSELVSPQTEVRVEMPLGDGLTFQGTVDAYGPLRGYPDTYAVYELKTKSSDKIDDVTERFRPQAVLYAEALAYQGVSISHIVREFIHTPTLRAPERLKNGSLSRAAITSTWALYAQTAREHELDPADYADMQEKLTYQPKHVLKTRINAGMILHFVDMVKHEAKNIDRETFFARSWSQDCSFCPFKDPCFLGLTGGDEEGCLSRNYQPVKPRYNSNEEILPTVAKIAS